jgi:hypothetical protein
LLICIFGTYYKLHLSLIFIPCGFMYISCSCVLLFYCMTYISGE